MLVFLMLVLFFFKQKTAYEMRISDWSSDLCSSDLIMRGPQSTLLGLNALAGAVIMRTAEPTMEWELRARAMITDADETQFAAALGGPIVSGELAFRVSVEKRDADGFTWNPTRRAHENPLDTTQVRAKLLWTPTAVPGFEARFGYTRYDRYSGYSFSFKIGRAHV